MNLINIIGIGQGKEDLTQKHLELIRECDVLVGGKRHLAMFNFPDIQKIPIKGPINIIVDAIKKKMTRNKIVVLASGDPLLSGFLKPAAGSIDIDDKPILSFSKKQIAKNIA